MLEKIKIDIMTLLESSGITGEIELSVPPKPDMGDFAFACFSVAKNQNSAEFAANLANNIDLANATYVNEVRNIGPYVNFFVDKKKVAEHLLGLIDERYGAHSTGKGQKVLVEYGCPNPMKVFHLGHLKNLITGEAVARLLENSGHETIRVNYQGDVGMHIAKTMWALDQKRDEFSSMQDEPLEKRIEFLGKTYAEGATAFDLDEKKKVLIEDVNTAIYEKKAEYTDLYETARRWSLEYFETIYEKLNTEFDRFYFESETFARGADLVREHVGTVFVEGEGGAIIYAGETEGLHNRVFINAKGYPTYEAKEIALAEMHWRDHRPAKIYHVVGKEQTEYFRVVIRAIEKLFPEMVGVEEHVVGGFLQLQGVEKMSSRKGNVISGDQLIDEVEKKVRDIMTESELRGEQYVAHTITVAALKYAMLKADISQDVSFDMDESVNTSGDSGPYLLYIVARIRSILREIKNEPFSNYAPIELHESEEHLIMKLVEYPEVTKRAYQVIDPSHIARYLFTLAQSFNKFYQHCPVLKAEGNVRAFRIDLIRAVDTVMTRGLHVLGIGALDQM